MVTMRLVLGLSGELDLAAVERAIAEIRSARPVVVDGEGASALVFGVEDLDAARCLGFGIAAAGQAHLVLPPARLRRLGADRQQAGTVAFPVIDIGRVETLALRADGRIDAPV